LSEYEANCPSFDVLADHTIAVMYHLHSSNGIGINNLRTSDILWAYKFLESIESPTNDNASFHSEFLTTLRKLLIERYADEDLEKIDASNKTMIDEIQEPFLSSSISFDEYLKYDEVRQDEEIEEFKNDDEIEDENRCSKDEIMQALKKIQENPEMSQMQLSDVIKFLENENVEQ
jgi:hypothetical protein